MLAYLVIREGTKWTDVFRLTPGRTVTIGRASTCQIVIKDERCSRNHGEVFSSGGQWMLRDLDSRNGTVVGDQPIRGDHELTPGEVIRIAHCQMAFVHDLSQAFVGVDEPSDPGRETVSGVTLSSLSDSHILDDSFEPTTITHRRGHTRYLQRNLAADSAPPKVGESAAQLCRLAFELANQTSVGAAANLALDGLFEGTNVDAGGLWLASRDAREELTIDEMELIASRTKVESSYRRVSAFLATMVLKDGEAVLARNIEGDSSLGIRDSAGVFSATSVICAPIRQDSKVIGLVHLYCTDSESTLDADDLEFTLAVAENVALALKNLNRQQALTEDLTATRSEVVQLRKQLGAQSEIIGSSAIMKQVAEEVSRAAPSRATILIRGESGVGKELVARAVHYSSPRGNGPFVCLNCAALSETLLESELFGHERGAFTGATERKVGKFEAADRGTLMLDEIGEMSSSIQSKFLRVLEGHPFERVGGSKAITVDVRVIAATNRDLERAVADGSFRRDLYFRLHVVEIQVPPLRKRPGDTIELANFFLAKFNQETGRKLKGFSPEALDMMQQYRWPGNVRELRNVVERAVLLTHHEVVGVDDLTLTNLSTASESGEFQFSHATYEPSTLADITGEFRPAGKESRAESYERSTLAAG